MFRMFLKSITKIFDLPVWFEQIASTGIDRTHSPYGGCVSPGGKSATHGVSSN